MISFQLSICLLVFFVSNSNAAFNTGSSHGVSSSTSITIGQIKQGYLNLPGLPPIVCNSNRQTLAMPLLGIEFYVDCVSSYAYLMKCSEGYVYTPNQIGTACCQPLVKDGSTVKVNVYMSNNQLPLVSYEEPAHPSTPASYVPPAPNGPLPPHAPSYTPAPFAPARYSSSSSRKTNIYSSTTQIKTREFEKMIKEVLQVYNPYQASYISVHQAYVIFDQLFLQLGIYNKDLLVSLDSLLRKNSDHNDQVKFSKIISLTQVMLQFSSVSTSTKSSSEINWVFKQAFKSYGLSSTSAISVKQTVEAIQTSLIRLGIIDRHALESITYFVREFSYSDRVDEDVIDFVILIIIILLLF